MTGLGCDHGWIEIGEAVRPRVLLIAASRDPALLDHVMDVARRLAYRARAEVAVPNGRRSEPPLYTVGGITVHRFLWRFGLAAWLTAAAPRYETVHLHGGGRRSAEAIALRGFRNVLRTDPSDVVEELAHQVFNHGVGAVA